MKQFSQKPVEVLGFTHDAPTMHLTMKWLTPKHFEVTYGPGRHGDSVIVSFQAVKIADVEITLLQASDSSLK